MTVCAESCWSMPSNLTSLVDGCTVLGCTAVTSSESWKLECLRTIPTISPPIHTALLIQIGPFLYSCDAARYRPSSLAMSGLPASLKLWHNACLDLVAWLLKWWDKLTGQGAVYSCVCNCPVKQFDIPVLNKAATEICDWQAFLIADQLLARWSSS